MKKTMLALLATAGILGTSAAVAQEQVCPDGHCKAQHGKMQDGKRKKCGKSEGNRKYSKQGKKDRRYGMKKQRGMGGEMGMFRGIDLSDAQKADLKKLFSDARKQHQSAKQNKKQREFMDKRRALIQSKTFDKAAFKQLLVEQKQQREAERIERQIARAERHNQAWNILTPEQQAKVKERFNDHKALMEKQREYQQKWHEKAPMPAPMDAPTSAPQEDVPPPPPSN